MKLFGKIVQPYYVKIYSTHGYYDHTTCPVACKEEFGKKKTFISCEMIGSLDFEILWWNILRQNNRIV